MFPQIFEGLMRWPRWPWCQATSDICPRCKVSPDLAVWADLWVGCLPRHKYEWLSWIQFVSDLYPTAKPVFTPSFGGGAVLSSKVGVLGVGGFHWRVLPWWCLFSCRGVGMPHVTGGVGSRMLEKRWIYQQVFTEEDRRDEGQFADAAREVW